MSAASTLSERVTWLLPVKNGMPFLPETLASIEAQTHKDWEILAWDNGSTDGTLEELQRWIPSRLPGRIISGRPLSLGNSLAALVEMAPTELCARIDADDVNHPERLARQVAFMLEHPQVGLLGAEVNFIDEHGRKRPDLWTQHLTDAEIRWSLRWTTSFNHPAVMFRRSVVLAAGNYADCMPYEDHDLWFRIAQIAEVANLPQRLVNYRVHESSVTGAHNRDYFPLFDKVAARYADSLFGDTPPPRALELRRKVQERPDAPVALGDFIRLRRAATATALALGKPPAYFRATGLYRSHQRKMLSKWLSQRAWGRAYFSTKKKLYAFLKKRAQPVLQTPRPAPPSTDS